MVGSSNASPLPRIYAWFSAVTADDTTILADLLSHGVPIDVPHPLRHSTALMEATRRGRTPMVQWLLEHGASPALLCGQPRGSSLHCALRRKHWDIAIRLSHAMVNCGMIDAYGATPLHALCAETTSNCDHSTTLGLAAMFIAKGCPLDALDREGTTALHHCVMNNLYEMAQALLEYGANPNARIPDSGVSPLTIAALEKNIPMSKLLLAHGADPQNRTHEGTTPASFLPRIHTLLAAHHLA